MQKEKIDAPRKFKTNYRTREDGTQGQRRKFKKLFLDLLVLLVFSYILSCFSWIVRDFDSFLDGLRNSGKAHIFAWSVVTIVSIPGLSWAFCASSYRFTHLANIWYWGNTVLLTLTLGLSYFLLPEQGKLMGQMIFATVPLQVLIFASLKIMPPGKPFTIPVLLIGVPLMIYGVFIELLT